MGVAVSVNKATGHFGRVGHNGVALVGTPAATVLAAAVIAKTAEAALRSCKKTDVDTYCGNFCRQVRPVDTSNPDARQTQLRKATAWLETRFNGGQSSADWNTPKKFRRDKIGDEATVHIMICEFDAYLQMPFQDLRKEIAWHTGVEPMCQHIVHGDAVLSGGLIQPGSQLSEHFSGSSELILGLVVSLQSVYAKLAEVVHVTSCNPYPSGQLGANSQVPPCKERSSQLPATQFYKRGCASKWYCVSAM